MARSTICCFIFLWLCGRNAQKYDILPLFLWFCGSMARSTICCEIHSRRGVRFATGSSASCEITHETGGTICYGHRVLHLVRSHTKRFVAPSVCGSVGAWQEVRVVASSFCGCVGAWQEVRFVAKFDLLPLVFVVV